MIWNDRAMIVRSMACAAALALGCGAVQALAQPVYGLKPDAKFLHPLPPLPPGSAAPVSDPRDFGGVWYNVNGNLDVPDGPGAAAASGGGPAYTASALAYRKHAAEMEAKGTPLGGPEALCRPSVGARGTYIPAMIVQSPDEVLIIGEARRTAWHIHLNRDHPKIVTPSLWGDSVGRWEGDTLVVDTIGFNGKEPMISREQHLVTRMRKTDDGARLEMKFLITDPVNYQTPLERTAVLAWRPDYEVLEDQCEENPEGAREGLYFEKPQ